MTGLYYFAGSWFAMIAGLCFFRYADRATAPRDATHGALLAYGLSVLALLLAFKAGLTFSQGA